MNKSVLKSYAPQARRDFIQAVTDRAGVLGLSAQKIEPVEVRGDVAMIAGRPFPKEVASHRRELEIRIKRKGFSQVMEEVAYTWFNRFTALRYMELHDYLGHGCRVLSNPSGSDIPEILEKATSVDLPGLDTDKAAELRLAGDRDAELYRLLLVTQCNQLHRVMPMLFEKVHDATELLLPENLLQTNSPIRKLVNAVPEENWNEIEIVGWLYQFYISEKKDQVIGKVVRSEDIPAATQLFTPNWIVKYMVQNTLGRKWLMTYPASGIKGKMEFYIEPAEQEPDVQAKLDAITPRELNPEELTFMDPACGSGHILAEAYDLFKEIYLERGYRTRDIPRLILTKNLYGLDIDDRAAQLARFTVLMKARADDRRILDPENPARLNIMAIQESKGLDVDEAARVLLQERVKEINSKGQQQLSLIQPNMTKGTLSTVEKPDVTREELYSLLHLFQDGKTFGSLLTVHDSLKDALPRLEKLVAKALQASDMESRRWGEALLPLVKQTKLLASQYDYVVANPPYMGSKGLNPKLKAYAKDEYPDSKSDLFAMFIERNLELAKQDGLTALITMQSWMFLSSFEGLRTKILSQDTILSMPHLGARAFDSISGEVVQTTTFVLLKEHFDNYKGTYLRLVEGKSEAEKVEMFARGNDRHTASASDFKKIPGSPIAYWVSQNAINAFSGSRIGDYATGKQGLATGDNDRFLRLWHEVDYNEIAFCNNGISESRKMTGTWVPYSKGGASRKWYGNNEYIVKWIDGGDEIRNFKDDNGNERSRFRGSDFYFKPALTWSLTSSDSFSCRYRPGGYVFDINGMSLFVGSEKHINSIILLLNSKVASFFLEIYNPTMAFQVGNITSIPFSPIDHVYDKNEDVFSIKTIYISKLDWDGYETSWDFSKNHLCGSPSASALIKECYADCQDMWNRMTRETYQYELENNKSQVDLYSLNKDVLLDISIEKITLICNPHYRYGPDKAEEEYEALLHTDTIKELISYAIGCTMGRYSLDEPGLIYAHSGNEGFDPSRYTTFPADEDGIVPVMDDDWFEDDATKRFVEFLKVAWSPETLDENLKFVADSLEPKRGEVPIETIRRFISQKFFKDHHLRVYKKRPIYWLFSSGRHKAFECLVYLHRYNENTLARMRAMYVTPLQGKLGARIEYLEKELPAAGSTSATKKLQKELDTMRKKQQELREFDEHLRHYADQRISLDLDDGIKVNYGKFGKLLAEVKAVTGGSPE
jgi:type II restriction/modification system DNA methylase subunit YeeA